MSQRVWVLCHFFHGRIFESAFFLSKGTFWGKIFFEEVWFVLFSFSDIEQKSSVYCWHVFGRFVKTAIYLCIGTFRGWNNFSKKMRSVFHPWTLSEKCRTSVSFLSAFCQSYTLSFQILLLRKIFPLEKLFFFQSFSDIERNIVRDLSSSFQPEFQNAFSVSKKVLSGNFKFFQIKEIFPSFCDLEQKNWRTVFYGNYFFSFSVNEQKFIGFCRIFSGRVAKAAFYMSIGHFREKTILFR